MVRLRRVDLKKEVEGVECRHEDGWTIRLRSFDSPRVRERLSADAAKALAAVRVSEPGRKALTAEEFQAVLTRVVGEEVIVGWDGIDGPDGKALAYSPEVAVSLMRDPELRPFQNFVMANSSAEDRFMRDGVAAIEGN